MITLYHCVAARSFRVLWMLEELTLGYALVVLPFPPRALAKTFRDVNPLGTIPYFIDGETRMSESAAVCQYLASRYGDGAFEADREHPAFGDYLNFLHFGEATLTFPQTLVLRYERFESPARRLVSVAQDYRTWFLARLKTLEPRLAAQTYIAADRFTAADVSVGYALLLASYLDMAPQFTPAVTAYWSRLQARPAFARAQRRERDDAITQGVSPEPAAAARPD